MNDDILKAAMLDLVRLYNDFLSDDYLLHFHYSEKMPDSTYLRTHHYIFGENVDWNHLDKIQEHPAQVFHRYQNIDDLDALAEHALQTDWPHCDLLSNDLIYGCTFHARDIVPQIVFDLSSAIFGKGTFYRYIVATFKEKQWLLSSSFPRGQVYNGVCGTFEDCVKFIVLQETIILHPYKNMIDIYPALYKEAISKKRRFI